MKPLKPSDPPRIGPFRTVARQVRGSYIAEVVDADPEAANPWLATAYSPGISVGDAVHRSGPLPEEAVRRLGLCIARAVADIHAVGLVHRDLKPDNVLLTSIGPKVIDFGIARGVAEDGLTRTGMVAGSPPYMAPEQLLTGDFGTGSDVFALAAILHFAATGIGPYGKGGVNELYGRAITIGPVIDESLPESLAGPLRRCLTKEPAGRPDAAGLALLLEESPGEDPGTGWLPGPVMAEILAQATEALSAESSGANAVPQNQPPQQQPRPQGPQPYIPPNAQQQGRPPQANPQQGIRPQQNFPQQGQPQQGRPQAGPQANPQAGPRRAPNWPNNAPPANNQGGRPVNPANNPAANQAGRGSGSGPNWSLGGNQQPGPARPPLPGPYQQQPNTPPRPVVNTPPRPVVNTPPRGVANTPPQFGQPPRPNQGPYGQQPSPYAVAAGLTGYPPARNQKATWAMVLALVSIPGIIVPVLNLLLAGTAIGLGINGNNVAGRTRIGKGQAMTGIILGTVMLILAIWLDIAVLNDLKNNSGS